MWRLSATALAATLIFALSVPWLLYGFALLSVEGRPLPPTNNFVSVERAQYLWLCLGEKLPIFIQARSPPNIAYGLLVGELKAIRTPGDFVVWQIAKNYNTKRSNRSRRGDWHLVGAGLTTWLTRNWSSDQILTAAHSTVKSYPERYQCHLRNMGIQR